MQDDNAATTTAQEISHVELLDKALRGLQMVEEVIQVLQGPMMNLVIALALDVINQHNIEHHQGEGQSNAHQEN